MNIIVDDRLEELRRLLDEGKLKDGDEFILIDIFDKDQWKGLQYYPGNWDIGRLFKTKLDKTDLPIKRHPDVKKKDMGAVYIVEK